MTGSSCFKTGHGLLSADQSLGLAEASRPGRQLGCPSIYDSDKGNPLRARLLAPVNLPLGHRRLAGAEES